MLLFSGCTSAAASGSHDDVVENRDGIAAHGQLSVTDGKLTDAAGNSFQLRGLSTHGICWYPQYINAGAMKTVKEAGGNVIRIAMYTQPEGGYLSDPEYNTFLVTQAIENAKAMDMYVLIDWHILDDGDPNGHVTEAITFFDRIASSYPNDPAVIYEICNEPNGVIWEEVSNYAYAICPVIRQYSPGAVIVIGTPSFSSDLSGPLLTPFPEENIMYSYHYYAGETDEYAALENAVEAGLPVMVSEWGTGNDSSGTAALKEGQEFAEYLNRNGISWCAWSLCNKDEVYSVLRPDCSKTEGFTEGDLTEVGKLAFSAMGG